MGDKNSDQSIMDKSMRSVFGKSSLSSCAIYTNNFNLKLYIAVGNIPYEATEEKLKEIFCEVGPVVSLK